MKGRIAFLLGNGFEDSEFQKPFDRLKKAGFDIDVIGAKKGETVKGYKKQTPVKIDLAIEHASVDDYVALVIPGGQSPDHLRVNKAFPKFVADFDATKRPLAAVCHGPQLLMAAKIVKGRTLTAWPTVQEDLKLVDGVTVKDEEVVVDDNWITSRKPDDLDAFSNKILEEIHEWQERHASGTARGPEAAEETEEGQRGAAIDPGLIEPGEGPVVRANEAVEGPSGEAILDRGATEEHEPYVEH